LFDFRVLAFGSAVRKFLVAVTRFIEFTDRDFWFVHRFDGGWFR